MSEWLCIARNGVIVPKYGARASRAQIMDVYWQALPSRKGQPFSRAKCEAILQMAGLAVKQIEVKVKQDLAA